MKSPQQEELRQRLNELDRFRTLMDRTLEAVLVTRVSNGRLFDGNETACRWLGFDHSQLLDRTVWEVFPDARRGPLDRVLTAPVGSEGVARSVETVLHDAAGCELPVVVSARQEALADGHFAVLIVRDVTQQERALRAVREREDRLSKIILVKS